MILEETEARDLINKVLSYSKADSASVSLSGKNSLNIRFALNTVSTCGAVDSVSVTITSNFGKKSGSANITEIDDNSIESGVRLSEEIAKFSPDDVEFMPPPEKQRSYLEVNEFFPETENQTPKNASEKVSYTLNKSISKDLVSAGYFEKSTDFYAVGNTKDLSAYSKSTKSGFSTTVRTKTGSGSSKINRSFADIRRLDIEKLSDRVIDRAILSKDPKPFEAGKYVTILDNSAVCDMVNNLSGFMSKRSADEGRSFFSEKNNENKIGEKLFSSEVNIHSDPQNAEAPSTPFSSEGLPVFKKNWITNGILNNLYSTRYWTKKTDTEYVPYPTNLIMSGTDKSVEDLIASTEKGIFVTRLWYIRTVDRKQMLLTGLTRDGVFLIEDGKITYPVNNFRFNESPANVLSNIIDMSASEKVVGSESGESRIVVPALKLSEFNFSTVSEAF